MLSSTSKLFTLLAAVSSLVLAQEKVAEESPVTGPTDINVKVLTTFPQAEVFGVKLVNGHATQAVLSVLNGESEPIRVQVVGGSLWDLDHTASVRNLTTTQFHVEIPAGHNQTLTYNFATELHPQELNLVIAALVSKDDNFYSIQAYNATVSIVEAPLSILDPQMLFLYLFLGSLFAATIYFIYTTWISSLFPQQKKKLAKGERTKAGTNQAAASEKATRTTGSSFDESWIPAQHLQRPQANRARSGTPRSRAK